MSGEAMHALARRLWPIPRSLTGPGLRESLAILAETAGEMEIHRWATGDPVLDWTIPDEWAIREAWIKGPDGERVVDFADHTLHVLGYSEPVHRTMPLEELQAHLYSLPELPTAIPYVTSYYRRRWGFCLAHAARERLVDGDYEVFIDADLGPGRLEVGEVVIEGGEREVLFSTYCCHPSMANNELSGPVVTAALARWLERLPRRRHTFRLIWIPETLGSIAYMSRHLDHLRRHLVAGWVVTCVGDDRAYSYMPSRTGDTLADRVSRHVLSHHAPDARHYSFLQRGSDERQYCSPRANLPVASVMRTKYGEFPEYHTSLDDLSFVTPSGLAGAWHALTRCLMAVERNCYPVARTVGEPQLGKRGLYPTLSTRGSARSVASLTNFLAFADGVTDLVGLADRIGVPVWECIEICELLQKHELIHCAASPSPAWRQE